ncbi:hypothetical protein [Haemophilus quentini]|nr:hypothetical protein [Haemophilus quentini]
MPVVNKFIKLMIIGNKVPALEPVYELDANGNKIQEVDEKGNPIFFGFAGTTPVYKQVKIPDDHMLAQYNYAKYFNKNQTHTITASNRFNATDKLHVLTGLSFVHFTTSQQKEMPVRYGEPSKTSSQPVMLKRIMNIIKPV